MSSGESTSDLSKKPLAAARAAFERGRAYVAGLSRPAKILAATTALFSALLIGWVGWRSSETTWTPLFTGLDREDASSVVAKLKESKIPYRVGEDGTSISVPEERARELRLELAGAGLPRGGGVGFESFDKMRLGATEFEQRVLFRRSLEGELSRTIDTIGSVQSARVHLVLPERSVFVGRSEAASASVVLKLRSGRGLGPGEVSSIVHLVSSSVAGLTPDRVAIVSADGTMLHKPRRAGAEGEAGGGDDEQSSATRSLEATLEDRARTMLEKVLGAGHVDVRVTAELERARVEQIQDRYEPKNVLRSEQRSVEQVAGEQGVAGVPGAQSNLPNEAPKPAAGAERVTRESSTRNFEIDHVTEKRLVQAGSVRRLTVAVVVDGAQRPPTPEELERLRSLVRSAIGADERRGDAVTVETAPFLANVEAAAPTPPPSGFRVPDRFRKYIPFAAVGLAALVGLGVLVAVRRSRKKAALAPPTSATSPALLTPAHTEEVPALPEEVQLTLTPEQLREAAHARAAADPATAALVLRFWLGAGEDDTADRSKALGDGISLA